MKLELLSNILPQDEESKPSLTVSIQVSIDEIEVKEEEDALVSDELNTPTSSTNQSEAQSDSSSESNGSDVLSWLNPNEL